MNLSSATEIFVRGFAFTRSFTHPYNVEQIQPGLWVMRDAPRQRGEYRGEEYVAIAGDPIAIDNLARSYTRGRFSISVMLTDSEPDTPVRSAFRELGYRLVATETLMVHNLDSIASTALAYTIAQVTNQAEAELLAQAARRRQIPLRHLTVHPLPMRQYMVLAGAAPIGWVGSIVVGNYTWCTNMYVRPEYRRQGIARAMLCRMLSDDAAAGSVANVLLASHAGAHLYPTVGYKQIGKLLLFSPPKG